MCQPYYKHRLLILSLGSSPAVITETLYGLAHQASPFLPTQLHIITTQLGQRLFEQQLQSTSSPADTLLNTLNLPHDLISASQVHVIHYQGQPLNDIQNQAHNLAVGDFFSHTIKQLIAQDPQNTQVHASIAGGRKTMSYYMGFAMSLFGRSQDSMSHVTLSIEPPPPGFYYPQPIKQLNAQQKALRQQAMATQHPMFEQGYDYDNLPIRIMPVPFIHMANPIPDTSTSFSLYLHCQQLVTVPPFFELKPRRHNGKLMLSLCLGQQIEHPIVFRAALAVVFFAARQSQHGFGWLRDMQADFHQQLQSMVDAIAVCSGLHALNQPPNPKAPVETSPLITTLDKCEDLDTRTLDNLRHIIDSQSREDLRKFIDDCKTSYKSWLKKHLFQQAVQHYSLQAQVSQPSCIAYHQQQGYSAKAASKWYGFSLTPSLSIT